MKRKQTVIFVALFILFCVGLLSFGGMNRPVSAQAESPYRELSLFTDVLSIIRQDYVEEVDMKALLYGGIKGMLAVLDPHSSFMPPDIYKEMQVETKGEFGGIGIEVSLRDGFLTVVTPIEDSPAFNAGVLPGDRIVAIDGKETNDLGMMDAVKILRGSPGTMVEIGVSRIGSVDRLSFSLRREIIKIESIKARLLEPDYALIRISAFQEQTDTDLKKALQKLHQENDAALKGLILDLRNNPGGLLDQAVKVSDLFLEQGLIVYTEGRSDQSDMKFTAHQGRTEPNYPIVVLINAGSASAAEIVAGALQDHQRAILLGTRSFGKGSVQTVVPLADGSGLRLTTALYYTPSGRSIQAAGIEPDLLVRQIVTGPEKREPVTREQDLEHHFKSDQIDRSDAVDEGELLRFTEQDQNDIQLMRALDLLKGWSIFNRLEKKAA